MLKHSSTTSAWAYKHMALAYLQAHDLSLQAHRVDEVKD